MKQITIMYHTGENLDDKRVSEEIEKSLNSRGYRVERIKVASSGDAENLLFSLSPENCQLLININMTGYELETTGGVASINRIPMNVINYITMPLGRFDEYLKKNHSYMVSFLTTTKESEIKIKENYPHIWNVSCCEDVEKLADFIGHLDWRY